jgi:hypothetical protein
MVKKLFETNCYKKDYRQDLKKIKYLLQSKKHFAFSKYADGELHILANKPINNGEFWFEPEVNSFNRAKLVESFKYKDKNYLVGISCPCCIGGKKVHDWMKTRSEQNPENLTWANLFVNGNYNYYLENIVPEYSNYDVYLVSNSKSNLEKLPFNVKEHYQIGKNCWVDDYELIEQIKKDIQKKQIENCLFLFCAGPFGNILTHQLYDYNKKNTYIDIGSTLNPFLLGDEGVSTRGYLRGESSLNKICVWGE